MGAKIFTFFISILFSGIVLLILFLLFFYHDIPQKTKSIKEYEKYISIINNGGSATICTRTSIDLFTTNCLDSITIDNEKNLTEYMNRKYDTNILKEVEEYNKKVKEYHTNTSKG